MIISAAMIVKNEEDVLSKCLGSIYPFVDEIVIVDTGSTDKSVKIAESYGAKVYHHEWQDNFSLHRNQAMSYCKGDWLLIIDADEELIDGGLLRDTINKLNDASDLISCVVKSDLGSDIVSEQHSPRLIRAAKKLKYEGIVHNQIKPDGETRISLCPIRISHCGYNLDTEKTKIKNERTERLLDIQLKDDPNNIFVLYNLANIYYSQKRYMEAIEKAERLDYLLGKIDKKPILYGEVYYVASGAYYHLGNKEEAIKWALKGVEYSPDNIDCIYLLLRIYEMDLNVSEAKKWCAKWIETYNKYKAQPDQFFGYTINNYLPNEVFISMGCCLWLEGNKVKGNEAFGIAKRLEKDESRGISESPEACNVLPSSRALYWWIVLSIRMFCWIKGKPCDFTGMPH